MLLDEYQDTGEAQRVLLTSLFAGHPVTAVGDPRQSIYGWRGASAGNLERFGADFAGAQAAGSSRLTVSFRNGDAILGAANLVADGIPVRGDDGDQHLRPGPGREAAGRVVVALHPTVVDEADWVAEQVAGLGRGDGRRSTGARSRCSPASGRTSRGSSRRCATGACRARWSASAACCTSPRWSTW